jgi:hypothetical protein
LIYKRYKKYWRHNYIPYRYRIAKSRMVSIAQILSQSGFGNYIANFNISACLLIEEYAKKNGYNFQHALNGGEYYVEELGYWLDGYDKEKNVVIEIDEDHHFDNNGNLKRKDIYRQKKIEKLLKCKFIRLRI